MNKLFRISAVCAVAAAAAQAFPAAAQPAQAQPPKTEAVTRVKAKLVSFDGGSLTLAPVGAGKTFSVAVTADTRYVGTGKAAFSDIKPGSYAGAAVSEQRQGLRASEIYLYAEALRGTGEGRFPEGGRILINGAVAAIRPADKQDGELTLHYRGAVLNGAAKGKPVCEGRASPQAYMSPLACAADAVIDVPPDTPVSALTVGDRGLLVPGSLVTVSIARLPGGKEFAPGVLVEKPPAPVEKPQSAP